MSKPKSAIDHELRNRIRVASTLNDMSFNYYIRPYLAIRKKAAQELLSDTPKTEEWKAHLEALVESMNNSIRLIMGL